MRQEGLLPWKQTDKNRQTMETEWKNRVAVTMDTYSKTGCYHGNRKDKLLPWRRIGNDKISCYHRMVTMDTCRKNRPAVTVETNRKTTDSHHRNREKAQ